MTGSLQVKNGKFQMVINLTENGKRKQKWISTGLPVKGHKKQAEMMLRDKLHELEIEQLPTEKKHANDILFSDYMRYWLTKIAKRVDAVTFQSYKLLVEKHILPLFDESGVMLSGITRKTLQDYLDREALNGRLDGKGGLSATSLRKIKSFFNQALNEAIRDGLIEANPCALLELPKAEAHEAQFYTMAQLNTLLNAVRDEPLYPVIKTAVYYGMRRSEILGMKWDSIDFENDVLYVKHTVVKVTKTVEKDKTKTKSSKRSFPLLPEMRELYLQIRQSQEANHKLLGKAYVSNDYVFCWSDGRPFSPDYVSQRFSELLEKNDLPHIRFHDLRHSCASLLINQGYSIKDVQEWMGHANISVTANIYGHLENRRKVKMAAELSSCLKE